MTLPPCTRTSPDASACRREPHAIGGKRPADGFHQPAAVVRRQAPAAAGSSRSAPRSCRRARRCAARCRSSARSNTAGRNPRAADVDRFELRHAVLRAADARSSARAASAPATCAWRRSHRSASASRSASNAPAQHDRRAGEQMRHQDHLRDRPQRPHVQEHRVAAMSKPWMVFSATVMRLRCRSITALGAPVVPPLKFSVARSSPSPSGQRLLGGFLQQRLVVEAGTLADTRRSIAAFRHRRSAARPCRRKTDASPARGRRRAATARPARAA